MPRRCLHGVHRLQATRGAPSSSFASALPARGASCPPVGMVRGQKALPRRCLHGVHLSFQYLIHQNQLLCLGAACTGCITRPRGISFSASSFASALPARGASLRDLYDFDAYMALPRRCLHGVHRQKPTNCGTPFCSIRRESVDSFSEINNKDSCADYFPALFCCQGDLHHHYRQPRTDNRPVLRCEQHRLFLFILSSHYRRLL